MPFTDDELETCLRVLQGVADDPASMRAEPRFKALVAKVHKSGKKDKRTDAGQARRAASLAARAATGRVRAQRGETALPPPDEGGPPPVGTLSASQRCYACKAGYTELHGFYHLLCPPCAELNHRKRFQRADLRGRTALVTGGRIKIGHQTALRMLRDGARVLVTTRFPRDAAQRFAAEPDFADWRDRLALHALDLRNLPAVEAFARHLAETEPWLDILVNNAAQTIRRPQAYYRALLDAEQMPADALPAPVLALLPPRQAPAAADIPGSEAALSGYFPAGRVDSEGQPLDLRPTNSWVLRLHEVDTMEMLEAQLINAIAPFTLTARLKPLLLRSPSARRFVVNASAMEGQFARESKTVFHPHTNMAKAALNMLTRTSAADYARDGIYMNSVDTGWITDENPHPRRVHAERSRGFCTPLDVIDGMARLYDPIVQGLAGDSTPVHGQFLKDYGPHPW